MSTTAPPVVVTELAGRPGAPVVLLGPSLGTAVATLWGEAAARLDGFHALGWDLPGHGAAPRPSGPGGFDLAGLGAAALAAADAVAGPGTRYHLAGDSVGGAVVLHLLLEQPERVSRAAILCSGARIGTSDAWHERARLVREEGLRPVVESSPARWFGSRVAADPTEASRRVVAELAQVEPEGYAQVCEALARHDVTGRLGGIATPLLALAGQDDQVTPADDHRAIARAVAHGRVEVLPGVGHLAPLEAPAEVAALLAGHFSA